MHDDPILDWMASNLVVLSPKPDTKRIAKERAREKIDGIAALVMGIEGAVVRRDRVPPPVYQLITLSHR